MWEQGKYPDGHYWLGWQNVFTLRQSNQRTGLERILPAPQVHLCVYINLNYIYPITSPKTLVSLSLSLKSHCCSSLLSFILINGDANSLGMEKSLSHPSPLQSLIIGSFLHRSTGAMLMSP